MMNSKELIIGHFEGTLSSEEARHLDELLETSPEVRAAYDQQRAIEEGMVEDSESLVPPIGLREATIAAAIGGALTTTVGGGITAWLGSKAAAIIGTVALGGLVVGGIVLMDDDDATDAITPATQIEQVQGDERVQEPVVDQRAAAEESAMDVREADVPSSTGSAVSNSETSRNVEGAAQGSRNGGDQISRTTANSTRQDTSESEAYRLFDDENRTQDIQGETRMQEGDSNKDD